MAESAEPGRAVRLESSVPAGAAPLEAILCTQDLGLRPSRPPDYEAAGCWNPHVGGETPRNFGPCGDVLDENRPLLFRHFERRYPYLRPVIPAAEECLLVPFYVPGAAVGTIWAIMHSDRRKFDAEDGRVMASLGRFASSAYQCIWGQRNDGPGVSSSFSLLCAPEELNQNTHVTGNP